MQYLRVAWLQIEILTLDIRPLVKALGMQLAAMEVLIQIL